MSLVSLNTQEEILERPSHSWEFNMILKNQLKNCSIDTAKDRDCWRAVVNAALYPRAP
jgi:hypothetical protein